MKAKEYFKYKLYFIYSILFVFCQGLGLVLYRNKETLSIGRLLILIIISIILSILITKFLLILNKKTQISNLNSKGHCDGVWRYFIILFCCHLIPFFSLYPGLCIYDTGYQIYQYDMFEYNTKHPLIHTYVMGWFKNCFENPNLGFACFTLLQIVLVDFALVYFIKYLREKGVGKKIAYLIALFYGLFPINSLLTISMTKDILFSACALIFVVDSIKYFEEELTTGFKIKYFIISVFMLLLRNNAVYSFLIFMVSMLMVFLLKPRLRPVYKEKIVLFTAMLIASIGISSLLTLILDADKGPIQEMLSIPAQEMAYVAIETEDIELKESISKYIKEPEKYMYYLSDQIKGQLSFTSVDGTFIDFLRECIRINLKHPMECITAILLQTQGYWDIFHNPYSENHYFLVKTEYKGGSYFEPKIQFLGEWYSETFYKNRGSLFMGHSFYVWIMAFFVIKAYYSKKYSICIIMTYLWGYYITLLLSPGSIIRYAWIYILLSPIVFLLDIQNGNRQKLNGGTKNEF